MNFVQSAAASVTSAVEEKKETGVASLQEQIATLTSGNEALKKTIEDLKQTLDSLVGDVVAVKLGATEADGGRKQADDTESKVEEQTDVASKKGEEGEAELEKRRDELLAEKEALTKELKEADELEKDAEEAAAKKGEEAKGDAVAVVTSGIANAKIGIIN